MKAFVEVLENGDKVLYSYGMPVVKKKANGELVRLWGDWRRGTAKHVKAFCQLDRKGFLRLKKEDS